MIPCKEKVVTTLYLVEVAMMAFVVGMIMTWFQAAPVMMISAGILAMPSFLVVAEMIMLEVVLAMIFYLAALVMT